MADQLIRKAKNSGRPTNNENRENQKGAHWAQKSAGTPYKTLDRHQTAVDDMRKVSTVAPIKESYIREATTTTKIR